MGDRFGFIAFAWNVINANSSRTAELWTALFGSVPHVKGSWECTRTAGISSGDLSWNVSTIMLPVSSSYRNVDLGRITGQGESCESSPTLLRRRMLFSAACELCGWTKKGLFKLRFCQRNHRWTTAFMVRAMRAVGMKEKLSWESQNLLNFAHSNCHILFLRHVDTDTARINTGQFFNGHTPSVD